MTRLKTLKDIIPYTNASNNGKYDDLIDINELKQEAINWIKENRYQEAHESEYDKKHYNPESWACLESWIMHFFNLSKEDLK